MELHRHKEVFRRLITFDIDANGILSVTTKDKATNAAIITITGASTLPKDEVERIVTRQKQMHLQIKKKSNKLA